MVTEKDRELRTSYILMEYDKIEFQKWKDEYRTALGNSNLKGAEQYRLLAISFMWDIKRDQSRIDSLLNGSATYYI